MISFRARCKYQLMVLFQRAQTEAVTFLSKESNRNLYAIPGLDYVAQDDIMPYSIAPRDRKPLRHELFDKFLVHTGNSNVSFKASETLYAWQERNHPWLELTEVHRETTENIRVTVIPFYVSFSLHCSLCIWFYDFKNISLTF